MSKPMTKDILKNLMCYLTGVVTLVSVMKTLYSKQRLVSLIFLSNINIIVWTGHCLWLTLVNVQPCHTHINHKQTNQLTENDYHELEKTNCLIWLPCIWYVDKRDGVAEQPSPWDAGEVRVGPGARIEVRRKELLSSPGYWGKPGVLK